MNDDPAHIKFEHKTWDVKQHPADPAKRLLMVILTAATGLPAADVDAIKTRVLKDGLRVYVTNGVEMEMLTAMRLSLFRAEKERDQNRSRADHYQAEHAKAQAKILELERELEDKRKTLGFLERGLLRRASPA